MDYDDLLLNTVLLLEERQEIRAEVSLRWGQILVDEFQDTNRLQARMLKLLASEHHNVMAVGDDSQSIYSFRGANFQNIMEFPKLFPDARIIKLEENYRSAAPILAVTNAIIAAARVGYPKRLFTRRADGPLPLLVRPESEQGQSRFVVKCIEELTQHGIPSGEIAVLFRAGFHSFDLEAELNRRRIPFVKYGGMKFIESGHIKDVLAHLKILNNPADRLSWIRILKLLPGVGVKTAGDLARRIAAEGVPDIPELLAPKKRKYSVQFHELMQLFKDLKNMGGAISEKVDRVNKYYFPYLQDNFDNYPKRMKDLDQLADMTTRYRSLNQFLNDMALEPPDDGVVGKGRRADSLVLSTIHSSKGLEWHSVILIWATEGRIPSPMAEESPDDLEEERRLLYVAATRAKHNLVIVAPMEQMDRVRGITRVALCRFIQDAPAEYFRTYAASLCD
jgi:DNA helicase-2/ATP-dependent DNA helicase PcrA